MSGKHHLATINFEAGDHAIPQNSSEIDMALRAAKVAWEKYPYLEHRYGERGRRFTNSDGCWLFTLARASEEVVVTKELEWLRTILASRGIPTVILEFHLQAIRQAISAEFPDQPQLQIQFDQFLSDRGAERRRFFGEESGSQLVNVFHARLRSCTGFKVEAAAELIASAWIDEHCGISGAIPALCNWLTSADHFSSDWIDNVRELLAQLDRAHGQSS